MRPMINYNGVLREMTEDEVRMYGVDEPETLPEPTEMEMLRADVDYILMMMEG